MIRETRCLVLVCDDCATVLCHHDTASEIHFVTAEAARRDAVEDLDWIRHDDRDLCPACACARWGHRWRDWVCPDPTSRLDPWRRCHRRDAIEVRDQGVLNSG